MTKIGDRHFMRYAGAEPAKQMRKEQLKDAKEYAAGLAHERSLIKPGSRDAKPPPSIESDDPSFITKTLRETPAAETKAPPIETDTPSYIARSMRQPAPAPQQAVPSSAPTDLPEQDTGRLIQEKA